MRWLRLKEREKSSFPTLRMQENDTGKLIVVLLMVGECS